VFLLLADVRESLYGGAAGGGKSDALLMAAAQYADVPGYAALLLRQSFPDLMQPNALIPRSKEWWGGRADWNAQNKRWTFPSGATVTFGYLERDDDVYQYQGAEYQLVGFDELTQHSEFRYRYLFSRLRRRAGVGVPLRMRGASNPGGRGHEWVKKRFLTDRAPGRVFVPARLADNPSLDAAEYEQSLMHLDPVTRAQLLAGDWDAVAGGRFKREWLQYWRPRGTGLHLLPSAWSAAGSIARHVGAEQVRGRFLTVDTASTVAEVVKDDPDYTVISAWLVVPPGELVWTGCLRVRVEVPDIVPLVQQQYARHHAQKVYIEGGGTQKGVVQIARRSEPRMNVIELVPKGDKLERAAELLNLAEAGRLWLPADDPVFPLEDVEAELLRFTGDPRQDAHDDIVDTAAMAAGVAEGHTTAGQQLFRPYIVGG
jgi:predicted phage terminase large subunit-like protein